MDSENNIDLEPYDFLADYDELFEEWYFDDFILQEFDTTAAGCCNLINNFFISF
ncbi:hypothetical protein ACFL0H_08665 [Thermodesulfobacteriota bacterium]